MTKASESATELRHPTLRYFWAAGALYLTLLLSISACLIGQRWIPEFSAAGSESFAVGLDHSGWFLRMFNFHNGKTGFSYSDRFEYQVFNSPSSIPTFAYSRMHIEEYRLSHTRILATITLLIVVLRLVERHSGRIVKQVSLGVTRPISANA